MAISIEERLAALERIVFAGGKPASAAEQAAAMRGWEELPVSFVAVGFSKEQYALRPERFPGEPPADRMVARGDMTPPQYLYNPSLEAWQSFQAWELAGRPSRDRQARARGARSLPSSRGSWLVARLPALGTRH